MSGTSPLQAISLYYREGSSDKVYHVQLLELPGGYVVNFQYGRRGSTLQTGTKTSNPIRRSEAEKIYSKLVTEKKNKGYTEGESGTPYSGTQSPKEHSGYQPQLANHIDEEKAILLLSDDQWCMQNKVDGVRQMILRSGDSVTAANRNGIIVPVSDAIAAGVRSLPTREREFVLDGEAIGDTYVPFDVLRLGRDLRLTVTRKRLALLEELMATSTAASVVRIRTAYSTAAKKQLFEALKTERAEGVIFKRLDAAYVAGRPTSGGDVLKLKFYEMATLGVMDVNDKRSVQLGAWTIRGWRFVGNVTIPSNQEIPRPLDLVEIRYLYRYANGSLFQTTYLGRRTDKDVPDDIISLKLKPMYDEHEW